MKKIIIYLILLFSYQSTHSQIEPEWIVKHVGPYWPDIGYDIAADNSGNIYICNW
jgi:hypothetical protein